MIKVLILGGYGNFGRRIAQALVTSDIPDLDLLPGHYGIHSIRFSAGLELGFMHLGLWLLSWIIRLGLKLDLPQHSQALLALSNWFNGFGTANGGMHVILRGKDKQGQKHERKWFLIAKNGHGPQIPCVPAVVLAKKLLSGKYSRTGAYPCVGIVSLEEYMDELKQFNIRQLTLSDDSSSI
jgi:hypothetical protein